METPGSGGAGLGDAISTETAAAPGCGRDAPGTGYRGGRNGALARPWCGAMDAERRGEQGPPLSPARDVLGRAFLNLTFQPQSCLPCPVCPALCQVEPLASVGSGGGAQTLSHPEEWSSGPFWGGPFPAPGGWRCSGTWIFPDPNGQRYRTPGIHPRDPDVLHDGLSARIHVLSLGSQRDKISAAETAQTKYFTGYL